MGVLHLEVFIVSSLIFAITPGIDTIFVLNKSLAHGRKAAVYATLGVNTGILVHTLIGALGLSIILVKSAIAFSLFKFLGAIYLIYMGLTKIFKKGGSLEISDINSAEGSVSAFKHFYSGVFTNVLNPKVALFFLAFFPQFIAEEKLSNPIPFLVLGITNALIGLSWYFLLSFFSGLFSQKLKENPTFNKWFDKISGLAFIAFGVKIAVDGR
ncbi:LysE family translocator [Xanthovirga aplysinae]|uniref:LysE family translocator n=1 Tax=Xanthovirga aplysinae TaxID=2529853 RepID=UPI0012BBD365|nr:LysE family translocator [Xanthovirga aplysinae]MTI31609.1 LysE family translocator [Xanthovirga aplysinae]